MLAIIISACLIQDPTSCQDYKISLDSNVDPNHCMMNAPPHLARWATEHPNLVIARFQCRVIAG